MAKQAPGNTRNLDPTKLERVADLLQDLKGRAQAAYQAGDLFMLAVYNDLLQVASPIVVKAHARLEREEKAALNKVEKTLRAQEKAAREAAQQQAQTENEPASA